MEKVKVNCWTYYFGILTLIFSSTKNQLNELFCLAMLHLYFLIVSKKYIQKYMYSECVCVCVSTQRERERSHQSLLHCLFIATNVGEMWYQLFCVLLLLLSLYDFPCGVIFVYPQTHHSRFYAVALPPPNYAKQSVTNNDVNHK